MFYENRLGNKKSVISLFTCFVRILARNSVCGTLGCTENILLGVHSQIGGWGSDSAIFSLPSQWASALKEEFAPRSKCIVQGS